MILRELLYFLSMIRIYALLARRWPCGRRRPGHATIQVWADELTVDSRLATV